MKVNCKPLGLAAAVAAASMTYAGISSAQEVAENGLGDLALVPYYTVKESWGTGVHIINTSDRTQVVKLRFRRGSDSLDSMDLNLIMSPHDEWVGFLNDEEDGTIVLSTQDTTCTAPLFNGRFEMPAIYREGADEGYIEVIGMGAAATESQPIAINAKHQSDGEPLNCQYVEDNFLDFYYNPDSLPLPSGMQSVSNSWGPIDDIDGDTTIENSVYTDTDAVLKVSWFIRDAGTGIEFGNDAVHIDEFYNGPMLSNQEFGVFSGNTRGFDFPDLDGMSPNPDFGPAARGLYNSLRSSSVLGVTSIINDWSDNPGLEVGTDWIITIPGQYVMLDLPEYIQSELDEDLTCDVGVGDACDNRDIPVRAAFSIWDREEVNLTIDTDRDVVISPSIPGVVPTTELRYEVNVIHWAPDRKVVESDYGITVDTSLLDAVSGWAKLTVSPQTPPGATEWDVQNICNWTINGGRGWDPRPGVTDPNDIVTCTGSVEENVPMIGFVAWERSFPENPDGNYGRAVAHSFEQDSED